MFKRETIKKYIGLCNALSDEFKTAEIEKVAAAAGTTNGDSKIGKVLNVSLPPITSCGNCGKCKLFCYDIKACLRFPATALKKRIANYILYRRNPEKYFSIIRKKCKARRKNFYFRWHQGGEIPDAAYFAEMVEIAREFPHFLFWTYTKMYRIVNQYCDKYGRDAIPKNLIIMFSDWDGTMIDNPYNFPVFAVRLKAGNKTPHDWDAMFKCPGNCDVCKASRRGCIAGEDTYNDEH